MQTLQEVRAETYVCSRYLYDHRQKVGSVCLFLLMLSIWLTGIIMGTSYQIPIGFITLLVVWPAILTIIVVYILFCCDICIDICNICCIPLKRDYQNYRRDNYPIEVIEKV